MKTRSTLLRAGAALAAGTALALAVPLAASAHVRIDPEQASAGSTAQIVFRVPTESATATTTKVEIDLPTDHPFSSASYEAQPGWTAQVVMGKLPKPVAIDGTTLTDAPVKVVFTATKGAEIPSGAFGQFTLRLGPVPDVDSVLLPAIQTYSDGTVARWDQPTPASGDEPEHPAPTLYIDAAPPADDATAPTDAPSVTPTDPEAAPLATADPSGALGVGLGLGGLALGAIALVVAVLALVRRPTARPAAEVAPALGTAPEDTPADPSTGTPKDAQ